MAFERSISYCVHVAGSNPPVTDVDIFAVMGDREPEPDVSLAPAGLMRRLAALGYDLLLLTALLAVLTLLVVLARGGRAIEPGTAWFNLALLVCIAAFFIGFWVRGGQTLGMTAWRLELRAAAGEPVSIKQALLRFAAAWLSVATLGLGFFVAALDRRKRTWHDRIAGTLVVYLGPRRRARTSKPLNANARPRSR